MNPCLTALSSKDAGDAEKPPLSADAGVGSGASALKDGQTQREITLWLIF